MLGQPEHGERLQAALAYRRLEPAWFPIPLCWPTPDGQCGCGRAIDGAPAPHTGKDIGKAPLLGPGYEALEPNEDDLRRWWHRWPLANIGVLLWPSKLVVTDLDGDEALDEAQGYHLPPGPVSRTGRTDGQGEHRFSRRVLGCPAARATGKGASGKIDVLSLGYVVAPPSIHRSRQPYRWLLSPDAAEPAPAPDWVANILRQVQEQRFIAATALPPDLPRVDLASLPVSERFRRLIRQGRAAEPDRWRDRSCLQFAVTLSLVTAGCDDTTIAGVLLDPANAAGEKARERKRDWLAKEIARARSKHCEAPPRADEEAQRAANCAIVEPATQTGPEVGEDPPLQGSPPLSADAADSPRNGHSTLRPRRSRAVVRNLADVQPDQVEWIWKGWIPQAKLSLTEGDPGEGKSLLTLDLAARVSSGLPMPDGSSNGLGGPAGVVLVGVEDGLSDTVVPRLLAAGADLSRIIALEGVPNHAAAARGSAEPPRLATLADLGTLEDAIRAVDARLMVIDPLTAFLPAGVDSHNDAQVRSALAPLCPLAERTGCGVHIVRHLNKQPGGSPLYRGGGSIAIIGIARSAMLVARHPHDPEGLQRVVAVTKCNLTAPPKALAYRIEDVAGDGRIAVRWIGQVDLTPEQLLAPVRVMSPERLHTLEALADGGEPMDAPALAARLNEDVATVRRRLARMADARQVERTATGQYTCPTCPTVSSVSTDPPSLESDQAREGQAECLPRRDSSDRKDGETGRTPSRAQVLAIAAGAGFPAMDLSSGRRIGRGPIAWRELCDTAGEEVLLLAQAALQSRAAAREGAR